jgi:hypothetical protein
MGENSVIPVSGSRNLRPTVRDMRQEILGSNTPQENVARSQDMATADMRQRVTAKALINPRVATARKNVQNENEAREWNLRPRTLEKQAVQGFSSPANNPIARSDESMVSNPGPMPQQQTEPAGGFDVVANSLGASPTAAPNLAGNPSPQPLSLAPATAGVQPQSPEITPSLENSLIDKKFGTNSWEAQRQKSMAEQRRNPVSSPIDDGINAAGAGIAQGVANAFTRSPGMAVQTPIQTAGKVITDPAYAKDWSTNLGSRVNSVMPSATGPRQIRPTAQPSQPMGPPQASRSIRPGNRRHNQQAMLA